MLRVGHFDPAYARNRILAKALRRAGAVVVDVSDQRPFLRRAPAILRGAGREAFDVVLVAFPGHADVPLARLASRRRHVPLVFDPLVSVYETGVEDRAVVSRWSPDALRRLVEDRLACRLADLVLVDTNAHRAYFARRSGLPPDRFARIWVGADDDVMAPQSASAHADGRFRVFFYGSWSPLHGVTHILRAAARLERSGDDVEFVVVGEGQGYAAGRRLAAELGLRSVRFLRQRPYAELPGLIAESDVCLGIFGTSGKAARVVPHKAFDALAMARPLITADTPAVREALVPGTHAWTCPPGDPVALADAILVLRDDPALRTRLATAGHRLYVERFSIDALSALLSTELCDLLGYPTATGVPR